MEIKIEQITCCICGVVFWITKEHNDELSRNHKSFTCPNGHNQSYCGETATEKREKEMQKKLDRCREVSERHETRRVEIYEELANEKLKTEELKKSITGYKGMLGRYKKEKGALKHKTSQNRRKEKSKC